MLALILLIVVGGAFLVAGLARLASSIAARRSIAELRLDERFVAERTGGRGEPLARFDDGVAHIEVRRGELSIGPNTVPSWELRVNLYRYGAKAALARKRLVIYRPELGAASTAAQLPPLPNAAGRSRVGAAIDALFRRSALAVQLDDGLLIVDLEKTDALDKIAVDAVAELARALLDAQPAQRTISDVGSATGAPIAVPR